jgi:hypothetical protein
MPLLKPSASDFTTFKRLNAQAFPVGAQTPKVVASTSAPAKVSVVAAITKASATAAKVVAPAVVTAQATVKTTTTKVYH